MSNEKQTYNESSIGFKLSVFIGVIVGIGAVLYGMSMMLETTSRDNNSAVGATSAGLNSAKAGEVTAEYASLAQKKFNEQVQQAERSRGGSVMPSAIGQGRFVSNAAEFVANAGKNQANGLFAKPDCTIEFAKKAREAGVSAFELKCNGCSAATLKEAGFTAGELRAAGYDAAELKAAGFTAKELKNAGFSAADLKSAGYSAADLKSAGYSASELKAAGFSAAEMLAAGYSAKDLKDAGFSAEQLKSAGLSAEALKAAGFTASELSNAGFSNAELESAGFSKDELKNRICNNTNAAKCTPSYIKDNRSRVVLAASMRKVGCTAKAHRMEGYSAGDMK